ncbi:MAG: SRPBCC family protein [Candidatus Omnitrophica bacterium]|nr:SRPBCC family protein [Candidatus Omnitrophota bacterium]
MSKEYLFRAEQTVNRPLAEVFDFFSRPENLAKITPPRLGFVILTPTPIQMKPGAVIEYHIRVFGVPLRWVTLITEYEPPYRFVDLQKKGPYRLWHHTHVFKALGPDRTLLTDEVRYALPLGILGELARLLFVRRDVESIFDYRRQVIARLFGPKPDEY